MLKMIAMLSALLCFSATSLAEIAVIVSKDSTITAADVGELERVYLGKSKALSGTEVVPINQNTKSSTSDTFNRAVLNKSSSQVKAYWSKLVFTGKGTPPKEFDNDAAVIAEVSANPNTVGYIDAASVTDAVKVLATF